MKIQVTWTRGNNLIFSSPRLKNKSFPFFIYIINSKEALKDMHFLGILGPELSGFPHPMCVI
jgi:hypothetical protein